VSPHTPWTDADITSKNFENIAMRNIEAFFLGNGKPLTAVNFVEDH
jgi:hypothetical protein